MLIKLLVIEYAWKPFFQDVVETTDPASGRSALLEETLAVARGADMPADSPALKAAVDTPGLRDFLLAQPIVEGTIDLGPYLFLSQTALAADRPAQIQSPDETARGLAARISSDDRIRSKAAILQARRQDAVIIDAVIRQLRTDLATLGDPRRQVSERLAEGLDGVDGELLKTALNETILEAAQLEGELGFTDLEAALQAFLNEQGLGGLVELFLTRFVSDMVTAAILEHVEQKTESETQTEALLSGIEIVCRDKARAVVERYRIDGRFNRVDWFGAAGARLGRELADSIVVEVQTV